MLDKTILNVPDPVLEQLRCSLCGCYLSCGPIRVTPNGSCVCGRCSFANSDSPIYRVFCFEAILSKIMFPCRFSQRGCTELLLFGEAVEHESRCTCRSFVCLALPVAGCTWEGCASDMLAHFSDKHRDLLSNDYAFFEIVLDKDSQGVQMIEQDVVGFLIKYQYDCRKVELKYDIRYCKNQTLSDASYKIQLFNGSDSDCSISMKSLKCVVYSESLFDFSDYKVLTIPQFLPNLEQPCCIVVKFIVIQQSHDYKDTVDALPTNFLNTLRCRCCCGYLVPPLFEMDSRTICCYCAEDQPQSTPSTNSKLLRLATETKFPCRWRDCNYVGSSETFRNHQLNCEHRHYDCFFPSCQDTFKLAEAVNHLRNHRTHYRLGSLDYKTSFSQPYTSKHIFTIRNNTIFLIQHSMVDTQHALPNGVGQVLVHRIALFTSDLGEVLGKIDFEHQHCKLKSIPFIIANKHKTDISLKELPGCFKSNDEITVAVNI